MIRNGARGLVVLLIMVPVLAGLAGDVPAIIVDAPWIAEPPPGAPVTAGYAVVVNQGVEVDRLVSVSAGLATKSEIHSMTVGEDGVVAMRPLEGGIELLPGIPLVLEPGGLHIMFKGFAERPRDGDRIAVTLVFRRAVAMEVVFPVTRRSDQGDG